MAQLLIDYNSVEFWVSCLAFGGLTAVVAIPSATLLDCDGAVPRILRLGLFAIAGMLVFWLLVWLIFLFVPGSAPAVFYHQTMIAVTVAIVTMSVGFTAIRWDGLRLQTSDSNRSQIGEGDPCQRGVALQRYQKRML